MNVKLIRIVGWNLILAVLLLEAAGHLLILTRKGGYIYEVDQGNEFISKYLSYVNHIEGVPEFPFHRERLLTPVNQNDSTFQAFSVYGKNCKRDQIERNILLQGDSWMGMINKYAYQSMSKLLNNGFCIINAGTGSFSPSNMEGQLGYFTDNGYKFKLILAFVDHTDIGDEYSRYRSQIVSTQSFDRVKPFNAFQHTSFYNYNTANYHKLNQVGSGLREILYRLINKLPGTTATSYKKIAAPLRDTGFASAKELNYFSGRMMSYVSSVARHTGTSKLIIATHPHYQHYSGHYKINLGDVFVDEIDSWRAVSNTLDIELIYFDPMAEKLCAEAYCYDYFIPGDVSSHPRTEKIKYLSESFFDRIELFMGVK